MRVVSFLPHAFDIVPWTDVEKYAGSKGTQDLGSNRGLSGVRLARRITPQAFCESWFKRVASWMRSAYKNASRACVGRAAAPSTNCLHAGIALPHRSRPAIQCNCRIIMQRKIANACQAALKVRFARPEFVGLMSAT